MLPISEEAKAMNMWMGGQVVLIKKESSTNPFVQVVVVVLISR